MKIFGCYGFPVSLSIVLIPQSSRLSFKSITHRVFLPLITFSVILFAILASIPLLSLHHAILHLLARAAIFTLDCHFYSHSITKISHSLTAVYNYQAMQNLNWWYLQR
ncbi:hypothetical protein midi_00934 [Candidatus Midichloria mitochondrii IricVA]|uniref:Uncharacterized protein n=1 Tax=Midichloria mitochondrii (strain IricVA) TaxID=696127 RepID=F7XX16_MIDMI|nr:hypothetical protein midi_00934 [Candidatus Midichloria mitochondrii IricVA]